MYPVGRLAGASTLPGWFQGHPAQPGVTTTVQHTTVNIPAEPPKDYVVWSICNFIYSNPCCLGLVALIFSIKGRYEGYPAQPGVTTTVQHTTVNIPAEPPKDYVVWSLCNFIYSNPCCLGLAALIYSIKARDRRVVGDLDGARHYASTARCLNIWATVLVVLSVLIAIITVIAVTVMAAHTVNSYSSYDSYGGYNYRG